MNRPNFTKLQWKIEKIPKELKIPVEEHFQIDAYYFKLVCIWGKDNVLLLKFLPQIGWDYDKLEWPFRAEFIIRSKLETNGDYTRYKSEFKTGVIEVGKEQFRPCTEITIAAIDEDQFSTGSFRYVNNITFEVYLIL